MHVEDVALHRDRSAPAQVVAESEFDDAARLAAVVCRTPGSMVMLLDGGGRWVRASGALRLREPALSPAFCQAVLQRGHTLVIEDASKHPSLRGDAQVIGEPHIRCFAGVVLEDRRGRPTGVLCVFDRVPRIFAPEQEDGLERLARQLRSRTECDEISRQLADVQRERETSAANLRASEELFRAFMNASPFLSYIKDAAGRLLFYNRSYARRFGISEYAWLGKTDEQLWSRSMAASMRLQELEVMAGGRMVEAEERLRAPDNSVTSWKTFRFPCFDSAGNMLLAGVAVDITEQLQRKEDLERVQEEMQEANDQLRRLSVTDELTGLRNRRAFEERLVMEFSVARRRRRDLAVCLLDVDNFKKINDCWGHGAGDEVLRQLSAILRTNVRLPDLAARYGGEEFVVLLPESGLDGAQGFAARLMKRIAEEPWNNSPVTVSIGIAALTDNDLDGYQLVSVADKALYEAKHTGKNRVVTHHRV